MEVEPFQDAVDQIGLLSMFVDPIECVVRSLYQ